MTNNKHVGIPLEKIVLASGSPRRSEILASVGWEFEKHVPDVDESVLEGENAAEYVERLALKKAREVADSRTDSIVLGSDTTVVIDGKIVGKPVDNDDAESMIRELSGRSHEVLTGIALVHGNEFLSDVVETKVQFNAMSDSEIRFLVEHGEPLDKAGGYAVQAQAALFIAGIQGDYWNVVGLPVSRVYELYTQIKKGLNSPV